MSVLDSPCWVSMLVREEGGVSYITAFINILDSLHFTLTLLLGLQMKCIMYSVLAMLHTGTCIIASRNYASPPPPLCMLAMGKSKTGKGVTMYACDSDVTPITDNECHMDARSLHFLWEFHGQNLRKSNKIWQNMIRIANMLAVVTAFLLAYGYGL